MSMNLPQQPLVSIDTVPLVLRDGHWRVVLGVRELEPYAGQAALPGVLLRPMERLEEAALRALSTKVNVSEENVLFLMNTGAFDNPDRDPRGPTLSIAHVAVIDPEDDPEGVVYHLLTGTSELPFDHSAIIMAAAKAVLDALWINEPLTRALLGEKFSTADVARLMRELSIAASENEPDTSNLGRDLAKSPRLVKAGTPATPTGKGRPAAAWTWAEPWSAPKRPASF
jgi:ADP-ribose pyrophosphatase YjhB (NUDIX family)